MPGRSKHRGALLRAALLAAGAAMLALPAVAPAAFPVAANGRITFAGCGIQCHVDVMNADGSGRIDLTNTPGVDDSAPSFSPDGRRIAFTRFDGNQSDVRIMNADGS